jgi:hypothetical protein
MPQFGRDNHTKGDFEPQRHKGHEGGF